MADERIAIVAEALEETHWDRLAMIAARENTSVGMIATQMAADVMQALDGAQSGRAAGGPS